MLDSQLVQNIKENKDIEISIKSLEEKHTPLIAKISSKYTKLLHDSGSSIEEIQNEKKFIIYKAAISYKEGRKTKFSTYLGSYARWYCLNKINKNKNEDWRHVVDVSLDNLHGIADKSEDTEAIEYIRHLLNGINDKKIAKVIELRYFSGHKLMSFKSISEIMGVSGQCVNNWAKKGLKLLSARAHN